MQREGHDDLGVGILLAGVLAMAFIAFVVSRADARAIMDATTECLSQFQGVPTGDENGGSFMCTDCDPSCDSDGVATPNKACTFKFQVCLNHSQGACTSANLKKVKVKSKGCKLTGQRLTPPGMSSPCGAFTGVVKNKKKGKKAGHCTVSVMVSSSDKPKKVDKDKLMLTCNPQTAATCPNPTTTTTTTTSTTTTTIVCGNGVVEGNETCDPPCQQGTCPAGMVCNSACSGCITPGTCACGATTPTQLKFTTVQGTGSCGSVTPAACVQGSNATMPCTTNADCPGGACVGDLACGGLYFGGGGVGVVLPNIVPDMGKSLLTVGCCDQDGVTMELVATTNNDPGVDVRTCTASTVDNGIYPGPGCLFGAPLPIPNLLSPATSTCVINRVAKNAAGTANCTTGASNVNLPLTSDIYLTGDLLSDMAGIQPCPVCLSNVCHGGPNNGMACTPGDSVVSGHPEYPTSHDCPPPSPAFAHLPIGFVLTTDPTAQAAQKTAVNMNNQNVFVGCGACGSPLGISFGLCAGGTNDGNSCNDVGQCPGGTCSGPFPCTSNADCAGHGNLTTCKQRTGGAFGNAGATTISENMAMAGGDMTDHLPHDSTLVSVFCIPPTFNGLVDGAADLPGPGAVALPGMAQLLP